MGFSSWAPSAAPPDLDQRINELAVIIDTLERVAVCHGGTAEVRREAGGNTTGFVEPRKLGALELDLASGEVVHKLGTGPRSYDRNRHRAVLLGTHPRDGDLAGGRATRLRNLVERIGHEQVPLRHSLLLVFAADGGETRVGGSLPVRAVAAGEQAAAQRRPASDRQVKATRHPQQFALDGPLNEAVGDLHGRERSRATLLCERDRARDDPCRGVGDPEVEDLARAHKVVQSVHYLLDLRVGIPDVDPVEIDVVGAQAFEAPVY